MTTLDQLANVLYTPFFVPGTTQGFEDYGIPVTVATVPLLDAFVDPPAGVTIEEFLACVGCYGAFGSTPLDGAGLAAALEEGWAAPLRRVQAHLDAYPYLTRLTSSISAAEMSLDPRFVLNDTLGDVAGARQATLQFLCNGIHERQDAPRRLVLADGTSIELPSQSDQAQTDGWDWSTWVADAGAYAALRVEQTGRSGDAVVLVDNADAIAAAAGAFNRANCGCDQRGGVGAIGAIVAAGAATLRRRRRSG